MLTKFTLTKILFFILVMIGIQGCLSVMPYIAPKVDDAEANISDVFPFESKYIDVLGSKIHYVESGRGPVVVLLHGNPTSSYLWRNIIPALEQNYRVIALDLIGMGKSDKPDIDYRLSDHILYFEGFVEALALEDIALVMHDWGGAIGLDYAANHENNVTGVAVMEAVVRPMSWDEADMFTTYLFKRLRDDRDGHNIVAVDNFFVEKMLPMMSGRDLNENEMAYYKSPYPTIESRKPVAQWPKEIPIDNMPKDNAGLVGANYQWLKSTSTPKLALHASPGLIFTEDFVMQLQADIPDLKVGHVGSGIHYIQETQPSNIGEQLRNWLASIN